MCRRQARAAAMAQRMIAIQPMRASVFLVVLNIKCPRSMTLHKAVVRHLDDDRSLRDRKDSALTPSTIVTFGVHSVVRASRGRAE